MNPSIFKEKKENNLKLKEKYSLIKQNKTVWLVKLNDKKLIKELRDSFLVLPANFILEIENIETEKLWKNIVATHKIPENILSGIDFIICDSEICSLKKYLEKGIVPIITEKNSLKSILREFNPLKNEGNSFLVKDENKWEYFYSLVKYLENNKFPQDNKNLVKNILEI